MADKKKPDDDSKPLKFDLSPEELKRAYNMALRLTALDIRAKKVVPFPKKKLPPK